MFLLLNVGASVVFVSHSSRLRIGTAATSAKDREFAEFTELATLTSEAMVALAVRSILILRHGTFVE